MFTINGKYTTAKVMIDDIDETTMQQIYAFVSHEAFTNPVAIMPDCHAGKGAVVGFTMPLTDKVIPNTIGVDIGCGMLSWNMGKRLFESASKDQIDKAIRAAIPMSTNIHKSDVNFEIDMFYRLVNRKLRKFILEWNRERGDNKDMVELSGTDLYNMTKRLGMKYTRFTNSVGTLGGGNHFIEVGKSENTGDYYITIHSGSRNFGKAVCEYHQKVAVERLTAPEMSKEDYTKHVKATFDKKQWQKELKKYSVLYPKRGGVARGTEYLEGDDLYNYFVDMLIAQTYAVFNRMFMQKLICDALQDIEVRVYCSDTVETTHNFIDFDDWVVRKGAIRSYEGEKMIIPFNPKDGLLICEGKSNPEWNYSAPHGAGRVLSRSAAKAKLSDDACDAAMKGVYASVKPKDESPLAYKDAKMIEAAIEPTATILDRIRPVMNLKAN